MAAQPDNNQSRQVHIAGHYRLHRHISSLTIKTKGATDMSVFYSYLT
jgi:hypothetical protein